MNWDFSFQSKDVAGNKDRRQYFLLDGPQVCLPLSFYFKERRGDEASKLLVPAGAVRSCARLPLRAAHVCFSSPALPDVLLLPGLHKEPILLLLIFEMTDLFLKWLYSFFSGENIAGTEVTYSTCFHLYHWGILQSTTTHACCVVHREKDSVYLHSKKCKDSPLAQWIGLN